MQGLSDLFTVSLQNDDVQDFDVRWDQALLSVREMASHVILEGLYTSKLPDSFQLQTVMALHDQEVARNNGTLNYQQLNTAVKHHIYQRMRNRNFRARSDVVKETHAGSVMTQKTLAPVAKVRDEKDDRPVPHQIRSQRLTARDKNPRKNQATRSKALQTKGAKFRADSEKGCTHGDGQTCFLLEPRRATVD